MNDLEILCKMITYLMDNYSESMIEDGTLTFRFDCKEYHYECKIERTIKEVIDYIEGVEE